MTAAPPSGGISLYCPRPPWCVRIACGNPLPKNLSETPSENTSEKSSESPYKTIPKTLPKTAYAVGSSPAAAFLSHSLLLFLSSSRRPIVSV